MRFPSFKTLVFVLAAVALIAGNVWAADKPIKSMADVAGTWTGSATIKDGTEKITVTIKEDGTFSASAWSLDTGGKLTLANGKLKWQGNKGNTGIATLTEDGELALSGDMGKGFALLSRPKKK